MFHKLFMLLAIVIIVAVLMQKQGYEGFSDDEDKDKICISGFCFTEENLKLHINEMDLESRKRLAFLLTS